VQLVGADLAAGWGRFLPEAWAFIPEGLDLKAGPEALAQLLQRMGPCDMLLLSHVLFDVARDAGGVPPYFWPTVRACWPGTVVICIERYSRPPTSPY
jgi:hypothetical protein